MRVSGRVNGAMSALLLCRAATPPRLARVPLCKYSLVGGGGVRPWEDPHWLREAERVRDEFLAQTAARGRVIRARPAAGKLRKRGRALDVARHKGAATDDEKRALLLVAVRQAVDGFDRDDLVQLSSRLLDSIDDRLDELGLTKEVRTRARRLLKDEVTRRLAPADHSGDSDFAALEADIAALVQRAVDKASFTVAVTVEARRRLDMDTIEEGTASVLQEWSRRVAPRADAVAFVEECLASELRRKTSPDGLVREDLRECLMAMWPALEHWVQRAERWARSSDRRDKGEALPEAISDATDGLVTNLIWRDREGTPAPSNMDAYVAGAVNHALNDALTQRSIEQGQLDGGEVDAEPPPEAGSAEPSSPPDLEELRVVLRSAEVDLLEAGRRLAEEFERRDPNVTRKQRPMFNAVFDVTTVTVRLLRADIRESASLNEDSPEERPWVRFLAGLALVRKVEDPARWLKPWTFRAMCLTSEPWAAEYGRAAYTGILKNNSHQVMLDRITAGGSERDYREATARGGTVALLRAILAPTIDLFEETRRDLWRGTSGAGT